MRRSAMLVVIGSMFSVPFSVPQMALGADRQAKTGQREARENKSKSTTPPRPARGSTPNAAASSGRPLILPGQPQQPTPAPAPPPPPRPFVATPISLPVQKTTLENGLRVVMHVDHTSPTVAIAVTYDVGARNEEKGHAGLAHLFEHLMFEGSANVPKGDHLRLVALHGANPGATTSNDRTSYFELLPSNELALGLWLEADRMKALEITPESFESQRKVMMDELRARITNLAYAPARARLREIVFHGYWPYEHDPLSSAQDLETAQLDGVKAFYSSYYAPNTAVLSLSGDFDPDEAVQLVHRFFDTAKKQDKVVAYTAPAQSDPPGALSTTMEDEHARTPALLYGWRGPSARESDHYALEVAFGILADGDASRLYQHLVRDKGLAQEVSAWTGEHRGPDLLAVEVKLADGARVADAQKNLDAEIARLAKDGPTDAEMLRVRTRIDAAFVLGLSSNIDRATKLGQYELFCGDARLLSSEPTRYFEVSRDDVKRVVARHLSTDHRATIEVHPSAKAEEAPPREAKPPRRLEPAPLPANTTSAQAGRRDSKADRSSKGASGKEREGGLKKHKRDRDRDRDMSKDRGAK